MGQRCHTEAAGNWNIVQSYLMWKLGWGRAMFRACHWEGPCCILFVPRESPSCFLWSWPVWRSAHIFSNTWLKGNTIKSLKVTLREVRVWSFPFLYLDASENASGPKRLGKDILISFVASRLSRVPVTGSALKHPFYISLRWLGPSASSRVQRWNVLGKLWPC